MSIKVKGLCKTYKIPSNNSFRNPGLNILSFGRKNEETFEALSDINFEVSGEAVGIIGKNGAGKSTLLKILSRITEPTKGRIEINGRLSSLLEVGTGFHPELSGRDNIYLNGTILGMSRREIKSKFEEIVEFSGISKFLDTPVKHYSSGMYIRLAFAVAAHLDPDILVIDEVLAVGDAEFQDKCLGKMKQVAKEGRTVLFVSHNMEAVKRLCSRIILLQSGRIIQDGNNINEIIKSYFNHGIENDLSSNWINVKEEFKNPYFYPVSMNLTYEDGTPVTGNIKKDDKVIFSLVAETEVVDNALTIGYSLFNGDGELLYWAYQTDGPKHSWPIINQGKNILKSHVPVEFLNEGKYRIELHGGLHNREWLFDPSSIRPYINFEVKGNLSESPYWISKRPGLVAPNIKWFSENA